MAIVFFFFCDFFTASVDISSCSVFTKNNYNSLNHGE